MLPVHPYRFGLCMLLLAALLVTACSPAVVQPTATLTSAATATQQSSPSTQITVTATPAAAATASTGSTPTGNVSPMIKVSDQSLDNGMVKIDEVVSSGPGWVVVYTTKDNGQQPDQPIGHTAVKDGDNKNVMVQVDPAKAQGPLYAQLQADKGAVGTFEFPGADEPVMVGVQMIASTFKVAPAQASSGSNNNTTNSSATEMGSMNNMPNTGSSNPSSSAQGPAIVIANQPIVNGKVVIAQVIANGDNWVVIHKKNGDGTMGSMVGFTKVKPGDNRNVVVPVDTNLTSSTMFAMLHQDIAKASSPQFPGVDVPVNAQNGDMISPSFDITPNGPGDTVIALGNTPATVSYLVDGQQRSLYISLQDTPGKSNCTGDCLKNWQPLLATGRIIAGIGVQGNKLGVALLPNGSRQVTYLGSPLYTFAGDKQPGDVNGQGLDGNWYLVTP